MKTISQEAIFKVKPQEVYNAFMNSKKHAEFTGALAKIDDEVGGEFEVWDGYATGKNIELVPGKKIVQTWRASDWPKGIESEITIDLIPEDNATKLIFNQKNIPDEFLLDVEQGWQDYYWKPMKEYLELN